MTRRLNISVMNSLKLAKEIEDAGNGIYNVNRASLEDADVVVIARNSDSRERNLEKIFFKVPDELRFSKMIIVFDYKKIRNYKDVSFLNSLYILKNIRCICYNLNDVVLEIQKISRAVLKNR